MIEGVDDAATSLVLTKRLIEQLEANGCPELCPKDRAPTYAEVIAAAREAAREIEAEWPQWKKELSPLPVQYLVDVSPWSACSDDPLLECFGDACDGSSPLPIDAVEIDPYYADEVTL